MDLRLSASLDDQQRRRWDAFLTATSSHYCQHPSWAAVEERRVQWPHRSPLYMWCEEDGEIVLTALVVAHEWPLPLPWRVCYEIDKGPVFDEPRYFERWLEVTLPVFERTGISIDMSPFRRLDSGGDGVETVLERFGFVRKRVLGRWATLAVDLDAEEGQLLHTFSRQTRQNIRKGESAGISLSCEDDVAGWRALSELSAELSSSSGVRCPRVDELERLSRHWLRGGRGGTVMVARLDGRPVAAGVVIVHDTTAFYHAAASTRRHSDVPKSHLLVWGLIRWAKSQGCRTFDMGGYSLVARPGDALWGVNQFKRGFAPSQDPLRYVAVHQDVVRPVEHAVIEWGRSTFAPLLRTPPAGAV